MSRRNHRSLRAVLFATLSATLLSSGCASLDLSVLSFAEKPAKPAIGPDTPTYFIELHGSGKPQRATMPLTGPTLVGDVIGNMRGNIPFARYKAIIVRQTAKGPHKMPIYWENDRSGMVAHPSNYAVHPNDRVIIAQNNNTYLDDLMNKAMQPLAFMRK